MDVSIARRPRGALPAKGQGHVAAAPLAAVRRGYTLRRAPRVAPSRAACVRDGAVMRLEHLFCVSARDASLRAL